MQRTQFGNWRELADTGYFDLLPDGRLALAADGLDGLVDFHTHLGWTFFLAPPINLNADTREALHNFEPDLKLNLDIYSGQNFYEERPDWSTKDYLPCLLSPLRGGKHSTHTIPNIIREMDALKIDKSVCLCIDLLFSDNSERASKALSKQPRLPFFGSVSAIDPNAEKKLERFLAAGAQGLKLHPEIQLTPADSRPMLKLLRFWAKASNKKPVLFHSGSNGFEPKWARVNANIERYEPAADALGDTPCILGHSAMNEYRKAIDIALKYQNVYLEIGGQPPAHILEMLDKLGGDRLLFGSDWPVYPQAIPMAKVLIATEHSPSDRIKILRDNAIGLLKSN